MSFESAQGNTDDKATGSHIPESVRNNPELMKKIEQFGNLESKKKPFDDRYVQQYEQNLSSIMRDVYENFGGENNKKFWTNPDHVPLDQINAMFADYGEIAYLDGPKDIGGERGYSYKLRTAEELDQWRKDNESDTVSPLLPGDFPDPEDPEFLWDDIDDLDDEDDLEEDE